MGQIAQIGRRIEKYTFPCSPTLVVRRQESFPLVAVGCFIRGGSIAEWPDANRGLAHLTEHVVASAAARRMELQGIAALVRAQTTHEHTAFFWQAFPGDALTSLHELFQAFETAAQQEDLLEEQKRVVAEEIRLFERHETKSFEQLSLRELFTAHPLRFPVCGNVAALKDLRLADVDGYLNRLYTRANTRIVIVGDVDAVAIAEGVQDGFRLTAGRHFELDEIAEPIMEEPRRFSFEGSPSREERTLIGFRTTGLGAPETSALDALAALAQRLDGELANQLHAVGAQGVTTRHATTIGAGRLSFLIRHRPGESERIEEIVVRWLDAVRGAESAAGMSDRAEGPTPDRLAEALDCLALREQMALLGRGEVRNGHPLAEAERLARARSCEGAEIARTARRLLDPRARVVGRLHPPPGPRRKPPRRTRPEAKEAYWELENGAGLLAVTTPSPLICCQVMFQGGLQVETEVDNGVGSLTMRQLPNCLDATRRSELEGFRRGTGSEFYGFGDEFFQGLSLTVDRASFELGLGFLARMIAAPVFDQELFDRQRMRAIEALWRDGDSWISAGRRELKKSLYPAHHPCRLTEGGTPASLARLSLDDAVAAYEKVRVGANTAVVVAGDLDPWATIERLAEPFEAIPPGPAPILTDRIARGGARVGRRASRASASRFALVGVGHGGLAWNVETWVALELVRTLLVGPQDDAVRGRLVRALRRAGIAYRTTCLHRAAAMEGYFALFASCEPDRQSRAVEIIVHEIERIRSADFAASELEYARKLYLMSELSRQELPRRQTYFEGRDLLLGGAQARQRRAAVMATATVEDVARAADRLLPNEGRGVVLLRPRAIDSEPRTPEPFEPSCLAKDSNPFSRRGA